MRSTQTEDLRRAVLTIHSQVMHLRASLELLLNTGAAEYGDTDPVGRCRSSLVERGRESGRWQYGTSSAVEAS